VEDRVSALPEVSDVIGDRWGVTDAEVRLRYPCDAFVPAPAFQAWRGVNVRAGAEQLWPWVTQIRLAPYSYDWVDNLGRRSPQEQQSLPDPEVGEHFTTAAGRKLGRILSVTRNEQLTGRIAGVVMSYVLVPDGAQTRLLLKLVSPTWRWTAPLLSVGDLVMARRQLLNLAGLAEQHAAAGKS
jgi:hypothetical protein